MNSKHTPLHLPLLLLLLSVAASSGAAFNITRLLSNYPDFASFNDLLSQTGLADEINSRQTITVLVVDNSGLDVVSDRPVDIVKHILSVQVILDYYDSAKLEKLSKNNSILTTLFQTTGIAANQAGFLKVSQMDDGQVSFGSAVSGAGIGANLVKEVVTKPYNISILQITDIIVPPGIDNLKPGMPSQAPPPATPAPAPKNSTDDAAAPTSSDEATAPASSSDESEAPAAETPASDAPSAGSPAADAPTVDEAASPAADDKSSGSRVAVAAAGIVVAVASSFFGSL